MPIDDNSILRYLNRRVTGLVTPNRVTLKLESGSNQVRPCRAQAGRIDVRLKLTRLGRDRVLPVIPRAHSASSLVSQRLLRSQHVMIMLGEPVGLIANVLQEPEGERAAAEHDRVGPAGDEDLLFTLGE